MARMLDVFNNNANNSQPAQASEEAKPTSNSSDESGDDEILEQCEEELPFIELNGLTRTIEGSPDVLSQPIILPELKTAARNAAPQANEVVDQEQPKNDDSAAIEFEPWPEASHPAQVSAELVAFHQPHSSTGKRYTELLQKILDPDSAPQSLLFTGSAGRDAISLTLLNLAMVAATQFSRNAVVVDLNRINPADAGLLGLPSVPGIQDVVEGRAALEHAVHKSPTSNLSVITLANHSSNDSLSAKESLRWLMSFLNQRFDVIFVDGGVWKNQEPQIAAAALCDIVLPIVSTGRKQDAATQKMVNGLSACGGKIRGLIYVR